MSTALINLQEMPAVSAKMILYIIVLSWIAVIFLLSSKAGMYCSPIENMSETIVFARWCRDKSDWYLFVLSSKFQMFDHSAIRCFKTMSC